ncbi:MAG: hypothetical protein HAW66_00440 [Shewanella sp.]|nr:hypothetical protein [Shewanella sp.]
MPVQLSLTAANIDERDAAYEIINDIQGLVIGDKCLIQPMFKEDFLKGSIKLETPLRRNMKDSRPRNDVYFLMNVRRRIETTIGQLVQYFDIEKINCRDLWHLTSRMSRKMLGLTVRAFFNIQTGKK